MRNEAKYQKRLINIIEDILPGCFIIKNDPASTQGLPDLLILDGDKWAMLEVKASESSNIQPNQAYYVDFFDTLGFAAFIYPENEEEVLDDLQQALRPEW